MMTRYFNIVFCAVIFLAAGSVANGLPLEDRFEQLTNNFVSHFFYHSKIMSLTNSISFFIWNCLKNEMKQMLAIKDSRLEALELKVQQHVSTTILACY